LPRFPTAQTANIDRPARHEDQSPRAQVLINISRTTKKQVGPSSICATVPRAETNPSATGQGPNLTKESPTYSPARRHWWGSRQKSPFAGDEIHIAGRVGRPGTPGRPAICPPRLPFGVRDEYGRQTDSRSAALKADHPSMPVIVIAEGGEADIDGYRSTEATRGAGSDGLGSKVMTPPLDSHAPPPCCRGSDGPAGPPKSGRAVRITISANKLVTQSSRCCRHT